MSASTPRRPTLPELPARSISKCRLQLRDYRGEQSSALCQRFLVNVLPVPSLSQNNHDRKASLLASGFQSNEGADRDVLYQPQPVPAAAFDRKEIVSGCPGETLRKLRDSMKPKLLQCEPSSHEAGDVLPKLLMGGTPTKLDIPILDTKSHQVQKQYLLLPGPDQIYKHYRHSYVLLQGFSLLIGQALSSALQIPDTITQKTEALEQVRVASLNHNKAPAYLCSMGCFPALQYT